MLRTVILCDENGKTLGTADLLDAHTGKGKLHRAFSVFVFTPDTSEVLIQKRSKEKMLWPLVWGNTCCSHPNENETPEQAGERRLQEEMGFTCTLTQGPSFVYQAEDPNGKGTEHEYDTILLGTAPKETLVAPDPAEVAEWRWISRTELENDMRIRPEAYAPWLHLALPKI